MYNGNGVIITRRRHEDWLKWRGAVDESIMLYCIEGIVAGEMPLQQYGGVFGWVQIYINSGVFIK